MIDDIKRYRKKGYLRELVKQKMKETEMWTFDKQKEREHQETNEE